MSVTAAPVPQNALTQKPGFSVAEFVRLWEEACPLQSMAAQFGVSTATICKTARQLKLKSRTAAAQASAMEQADDDPTIEEILERAAEIRAGWSEEEKMRRISRAVSRVELRHYIYHPYTASFSSMQST